MHFLDINFEYDSSFSQYDENLTGNNTLERSVSGGGGGSVGNIISGGKSSPHQSDNTLKKSNLNVSQYCEYCEQCYNQRH